MAEDRFLIDPSEYMGDYSAGDAYNPWQGKSEYYTPGGGWSPSGWGYGSQPVNPLGTMAEEDARKASEAEWKARGSGNTFSRSVSGGGGGGGGYGGGGGGGYEVTNTGKYSSIPTAPTPPTLSLPSFQTPTYEEGKVKKYAQKAASPGLRTLRSQVQRAMMKQSDNPNVTRMTLREALAGFGEGLAKTMASAQQAGRQEYESEYGRQYKQAQADWQKGTMEAQANWKAQIDKQNQEYDALLKDFFAQYGKGGGTSGMYQPMSAAEANRLYHYGGRVNAAPGMSYLG